MKSISLKRFVIFILSILFLSSCGGGGGGSDSSSGSSGNGDNSIKGVVADGYLQGAIVCLDTSNNGRCDTGEPQVTSGASGTYSLNISSSININDYYIIVEVGTEVIDADIGTAIGIHYNMSSPKGKNDFINPISTLIKQTLDSNPMNEEQAKSLVLNKLGYTDGEVNPYEDFISSTTTEATQLHGIAQTVARLMGKNKKKLEQVYKDATTELTADEEQALDLLIFDAIDEVLETVATQVKEYSGKFDSETADNLTDDVGGDKLIISEEVPSKTDLENKIKEKKENLRIGQDKNKYTAQEFAQLNKQLYSLHADYDGNGNNTYKIEAILATPSLFYGFNCKLTSNTSCTNGSLPSNFLANLTYSHPIAYDLNGVGIINAHHVDSEVSVFQDLGSLEGTKMLANIFIIKDAIKIIEFDANDRLYETTFFTPKALITDIATRATYKQFCVIDENGNNCIDRWDSGSSVTIYGQDRLADFENQYPTNTNRFHNNNSNDNTRHLYWLSDDKKFWKYCKASDQNMSSSDTTCETFGSGNEEKIKSIESYYQYDTGLTSSETGWETYSRLIITNIHNVIKGKFFIHPYFDNGTTLKRMKNTDYVAKSNFRKTRLINLATMQKVEAELRSTTD